MLDILLVIVIPCYIGAFIFLGLAFREQNKAYNIKYFTSFKKRKH